MSADGKKTHLASGPVHVAFRWADGREEAVCFDRPVDFWVLPVDRVGDLSSPTLPMTSGYCQKGDCVTRHGGDE